MVCCLQAVVGGAAPDTAAPAGNAPDGGAAGSQRQAESSSHQQPSPAQPDSRVAGDGGAVHPTPAAATAPRRLELDTGDTAAKRCGIGT